MVIDTEDITLYEKDCVIPLLIYPEKYNTDKYYPCESLIGPPFTEPTSEPRHLSID